MTPEQLGQHLVDAAGGDSTCAVEWGTAVVDVPPGAWVETVRTARDDAELALTFFDWLSAVDHEEAGFEVVLHLWSVTRHHHVLLRTRVPRDEPSLPSLTSVFAGAGWAERETWEMFGIVFTGHPHLVPLLLPDGFEGHPLRKSFVLASRVAKTWPGAKEPGESDHDGPAGQAGPTRPRRRAQPLGVPPPDSWPAY